MPYRRPGRPVDPELRDRRRAQILDRAARVFAKRGFEGADVQEIADGLGVGKGTVYRYFPTKSALFLAAADAGMGRLMDAVNSAAARVEDPLRRIEVAIRAYLEFFHAHPEFAELLILERAVFRDRRTPTYFVNREANSGPWKKLIRSLMDAGRIRRMPLARIVDTLSDLVYGTMFTNFFAARPRRPATQAADLFGVIAGGILTESELKRRAASKTGRKSR